MPSVDLNADMGESYGAWKMGDDAALLDIVTSANIACGGHAGDADVMAATMRIAHDNGVGIGAHPGFMDIAGFGRNRMSCRAPPCRTRSATRLPQVSAWPAAWALKFAISSCMAPWPTWPRKMKVSPAIFTKRR